MTFEELEPDTGIPNWGCPRLSEHGAGWLIDWFNAEGQCTGASVAKGEQLEWIKAHPEDVAEMQTQVAQWLRNV